MRFHRCSYGLRSRRLKRLYYLRIETESCNKQLYTGQPWIRRKLNRHERISRFGLIVGVVYTLQMICTDKEFIHEYMHQFTSIRVESVNVFVQEIIPERFRMKPGETCEQNRIILT